MKFLVTGGCGFIGSHFIDRILKDSANEVINIDKLTYASSQLINKKYKKNKKYKFIKTDINNHKIIKKILKFEKIDYLVNFAAETHVDNSINNFNPFIHTNIYGTLNLLNCSVNAQNRPFFIQISTDEVFGELKNISKSFSENSKYNPGNPYSASKASADFFVKSFFKTFKLNYLIIHMVNNYGPRQHKEKFIPKIILNALHKKKIPVYGKGNQIRNWIYVKDSVDAIYKLIISNYKNKHINISSNCEVTNLKLLKKILKLVSINNYKNNLSLINFTKDRPGHDIRYSLNSKKIHNLIDWKAKTSFKKGLIETINSFKNSKFK